MARKGFYACCVLTQELFMLAVDSFAIPYRRKFSLNIIFCYFGFEFVREFAC
jgi:hypothetical protein